eukprot:8899479-Alexandrium_andersonii.AAC.1
MFEHVSTGEGASGVQHGITRPRANMCDAESGALSSRQLHALMLVINVIAATKLWVVAIRVVGGMAIVIDSVLNGACLSNTCVGSFRTHLSTLVSGRSGSSAQDRAASCDPSETPATSILG